MIKTGPTPENSRQQPIEGANSMKTKVMLIVLFLLASTCAITTMAEEITASLIHRFDAVLMRRDVAEMLALLVELDSSEAWSFGAGIGPTDADFLQTQIVQVLYDRFLDENNRIKGDDLNGNGAAEKGGGAYGRVHYSRI